MSPAIDAVKLQLKKWENEFSQKFNRKPSKDDIKIASDEVKDAYKLYWKLKTPVVPIESNVWGNHLNKKKERISAEDKNKKKSVLDSYSRKISCFQKTTSQVSQFSDQPTRVTESISKPLSSSDLQKNLPKDLQKDLPKDLQKDLPNDLQKDLPSNLPNELANDLPMDWPKRTGFKIVVSNNDKSFNAQPVSVISNVRLFGTPSLTRRLPVNKEWLQRCSDLEYSEKTKPHSQNIECGRFDNYLRQDASNYNDFEKEADCVISVPPLTETSSYNIPNVELKKQGPNDAFDFQKKIDCAVSVTPIKEISCSPNTQLNTQYVENQNCTDYSKSLENQEKTKPACVVNRKRSVDPFEFTECSSSPKRVKPDLSVKSDDSKIGKPNKVRSVDTTLKYSTKSDRKQKILERKLKSGSANENFVRIDLKKKIFCRGKRKFNLVSYKRKQWLQRKQNREDGDFGDVKSRSKSTCFRCGGEGHWARNCRVKKNEAEDFTEGNVEKESDEEGSPFLTLEEAAALARGVRVDASNASATCVYPEKITAEELDKDSKPLENSLQIEEDEYVTDKELILEQPSFEPLFTTEKDGRCIATPKSVFAALRKFGYNEFRPGQEETIMRILSGRSTVLILSTGAGKSLCYQLPAYLYAQRSPCITLVISPLVSLMEDQVTGLPACLKAVCLHSSLTPVQRQKAYDAIASGNVHFLLVSPEMAVGGKGSSQGLPQNLPPISFACIDEAHCVSEWSHNFRPSYLRLCKVLRTNFGVNCILALTATATTKTADSIAKYLQLSDDLSAVIRGPPLPKNLHLSVSRDEDKDGALLELLKGKRFSDCHSIIIYCTRREQTERLATMIRTCFQDVHSGSKVCLTAEAYHAGMSSAKRRSVQKNFMSGKLQIVVATVAFGMGLDKADVRAVIHYNMPKRFENYVQEIGRAGRDGNPAHCHLFLNVQGGDLCELRRHIYCNSVDRSTLRKLLGHVFPPCKCNKLNEASCGGKTFVNCKKHEVAVPIHALVEQLDLKEESIATLLCYLELAPERWIEILNPVYAMCKVNCYSGAKQLKTIARKCPPLAVAVALEIQKGEDHAKSSKITFPVVSIASNMGWESGIVKRELKSLQWNTSLLKVGGRVKKSGVIVEFTDLAFHFQAPGNLSDEQLDAILDYIHLRVTNQEKTELYQLRKAYESFYNVSKTHYWSCSDEFDETKSKQLKDALTVYFENETFCNDSEDCAVFPDDQSSKKEDCVRSDVRNFLSIYHDQSFTGRAIARIFSGIGSPCFPAEVWGRVRRFWRSYLDVEFDLLCRWATQEIIRLK